MLLHEGLGSVRLWRDFPAALADATGARVVAFSRFGHGDSDPPPRPRTPRFMHEEALEVLPAVLRAMEIDEPVLVGHSDGASIALIHAAAHPVSAVVAIAPHVFVEEMCLAEIREAKRAYEADGLRAADGPPPPRPRRRLLRLERRLAASRVPATGTSPTSCPTSPCPLLLIQGEHDQYGTMAQLDAIEAGVSGPGRARASDRRATLRTSRRRRRRWPPIAGFVRRLADRLHH